MNSSAVSRRIASHRLLTPQGIVNNPLVEVAADGTILSVDTCDAPDRLACTEFYAGLLVPGLINAHCHLEFSALRGQVAAGGGFVAFARSLREARAACSAEMCEEAVAVADAQMWHAGIAAVGDICNGETTFLHKRNSPITYRNFAEIYGLKRRSTTALQPLLRYPLTTLTPHSTYTVQDALFRSICAEGDGILSLHFLETAAESALFEQRGALWDWYQREGLQCDFLDYGSPAQRLVESVPANRCLLLVHNCCVTQADIDLIMNHFTAPVWWCLCPRSNRFISNRMPPVDLLRANKLNICVGTDSLASNEDLSLIEELRCFTGVPLPELLNWATVNGAQALGLDATLGAVAVGQRPGLSVLSGIDLSTLSFTPNTTIHRLL
ncbi:MAG: amidohydrolase family protein [Alistipes sp.]